MPDDEDPGHDDARALTWRVVSRTPGADYRIFRATSVRAAHPATGAERDFVVLAVPEWVNVIAFTPEDRIVLIRQYRQGADRVHLEIPGGMVDPGEDHATAARRELREETGYEAASWRHVGTVEPNPAFQDNRLQTWVAFDARPTAPVEPDPGEVIRVLTALPADVTAMLRDGRIDHALVVAAFAHLLLAAGEVRRPPA